MEHFDLVISAKEEMQYQSAHSTGVFQRCAHYCLQSFWQPKKKVWTINRSVFCVSVAVT